MAKSSFSRFYIYMSPDWENNIYKRFCKLISLDPKMRILLKKKNGDTYELKSRDRTSHAVRKLMESYVNKYEPLILKQIEENKSQNIQNVTTQEEEIQEESEGENDN